MSTGKPAATGSNAERLVCPSVRLSACLYRGVLHSLCSSPDDQDDAIDGGPLTGETLLLRMFTDEKGERRREKLSAYLVTHSVHVRPLEVYQAAVLTVFGANEFPMDGATAVDLSLFPSLSTVFSSRRHCEHSSRLEACSRAPFFGSTVVRPFVTVGSECTISLRLSVSVRSSEHVRRF